MLLIPNRTQGVMTGTAFCGVILNLAMNESRELTIEQQLQLGNVPAFLRNMATIEYSENGQDVKFWAALDYLSVGTDEDYVRVPLFPKTAQRVADAFGAVLPTPKMVDRIWQQADVRLEPHPMPPTGEMTTTKWFLQHNEIINRELEKKSVLGELVAGHKKDVVVCRSMNSTHVSIYGWHHLLGKPIQGCNSTSHSANYADYSHGIRLIKNTCEINGQEMWVEDVLKDERFAPLLNDGGPLTVTRYT